MRIEITSKGVANNRRVFATPLTAGRPRSTAEIVKSRKPFVEAPNRELAIKGLLELVGFEPADALR